MPRLHRPITVAFIALLSCFYIYSITLQTRIIAKVFPQDQLRDDSPQHQHQEHHRDLVSSSSSSSSSPSRPSDISLNPLPPWIDEYFRWHNAMRLQYPGTSIFTHPDSPGVLIKACSHKCGGLHDRFGGLGWDLYLANQTRRVLLIHWCIPAPIEHYLVPNDVDWTLPRNPNDSTNDSSSSSKAVLDERLFSNTTETHTHCDRAVNNWPGLFDGYNEYRPSAEFWQKQVDLALDRAIHGSYSQHNILRVKILGFDIFLKQRLLARHNETDAIGWTDSLAAIFWRMFKPSVGLQKELDEAYAFLGLTTASLGDITTMDMMTTKTPRPLPPFYAIHVRIRHPRGHVGQTIAGLGKGNPDKDGLQWMDGPTKNFAISVAEHAFHCAKERVRHLAEGKRGERTAPIFVFFADSEDLVAHMGTEHRGDGLRVQNMTGMHVLHIDRQQEMPPESYYSAFIDLFVAARAS